MRDNLPDPVLVATGIEGLDDVLGGGLPARRIYLVEGKPGAGKTTLGMQFLLEGGRRGERGLYVTLAETAQALRQVARSHGWSLDGIAIHELPPLIAADDVEGDEPYTVFHPAEVELGRTTDALFEQINRLDPARVVLDSLSEIRLLAQHPLRYRREILTLKQRFAGSARTVLLLDDRVGNDGDAQLRSLAHGVILLDQEVPRYGVARRRLTVAKLRGVDHRTGLHDFVIARGGLRVFPRLVAAEHRAPAATAPVASGIVALDALLGGGIDYGTTTLVTGPPGSGKSSFAVQYVAAAAARGDVAAIFTFDEALATFRGRADAFGLELGAHIDAGRVRAQQVDPAELTPGEFVHRVRAAVEQHGARVVVIDSLNGYLQAMPDEPFVEAQLHELTTYLGQRGVATLLVATQQGLVGPTLGATVDVSYLADAVVLLRFFEADGHVRRAISVLKKRTGPHEDAIREIAFGPGGLRVGEPLAGFHGLLTNVPSYVGAIAPLFAGGRDAGFGSC